MRTMKQFKNTHVSYSHCDYSDQSIASQCKCESQNQIMSIKIGSYQSLSVDSSHDPNDILYFHGCYIYFPFVLRVEDIIQIQGINPISYKLISVFNAIEMHKRIPMAETSKESNRSCYIPVEQIIISRTFCIFIVTHLCTTLFAASIIIRLEKASRYISCILIPISNAMKMHKRV